MMSIKWGEVEKWHMPFKLGQVAPVMSQPRMPNARGIFILIVGLGRHVAGCARSRLGRENARLPCTQLVVSKHAQHLPPLPSVPVDDT